MTAWLVPVGLVLLLAGIWAAAAIDAMVGARTAGRSVGNPALVPLRFFSRLVLQQAVVTEHPDLINRRVAPALYLGLALIGLAPLPLAVGVAIVDPPAGIVLWGAVEAMMVIAVFLQGWSANSQLPLIGAYRFVATGVPIMLISMFVLIAAVLPAQSLAFSALVESQRGVWNVLRQPLGLPLFLLVGLSLTLRGPFDYADSADLAGGTSAETSGADRAIWQLARLAMLVSFSAVASTAFLGGPLGPWLPGPLWLIVKTVVVMLLLIVIGHQFARTPVATMMKLIWIVATPLAFIDLLWAGIGALK